MDANSVWRKSLTVIPQEWYELYWTNSRNNILINSNCTATYFPSPKPSKSDEQDMQDIAGGGVCLGIMTSQPWLVI